VATGSGNTAISAARRFCEVTGMDLAPEWIEHARSRADAEGMEITFEVGDAEDLSYPDASFDVVLSSIGVMFCPTRSRRRASCSASAGPEARSGSPAGRPTAYTATC
jgi:ubiquinone/menaquinone biosynthesis C-methylase UbiE